MGHSSPERRLRADVEKRYELKNELTKKRLLINRLTWKLRHTKKRRLNNRYSATIKRLNAETGTLGRKLNEMNVELQKRIMEEMEFSEEEIRNFSEQYQKEHAEVQEMESRLKAIEEETVEPDVEETSEGEAAPKGAVAERTRRILRRERRTVEGIQREIDSEERDKVFFTRELRQITAELEAYTH